MLKTEMRNEDSMHIDRMDTVSMLEVINRENMTVAPIPSSAYPST